MIGSESVVFVDVFTFHVIRRSIGGVTPVVSRALKMEGPAGADFPETTTSVKALPELSELQEEVEEVVCECLITAVALLEVADGKEKDRREIKIASGVQNFVEVEIVASVRSVCSWRPLRKVTAVTVCGCKILSWMRRLRWLLQATAMTEQCMIGLWTATPQLNSAPGGRFCCILNMACMVFL